MNPSHQSLNTINVDDPFAMRYWARQLRISETQLRAAVAAAGNNIAAVRQQVGKLSPQSRPTGRART